jgi:hypothetical protein
MEFLAEEGHANAPFWLMQHLELTEVIRLPSPSTTAQEEA